MIAGTPMADTKLVWINLFAIKIKSGQYIAAGAHTRISIVQEITE